MEQDDEWRVQKDTKATEEAREGRTQGTEEPKTNVVNHSRALLDHDKLIVVKQVVDLPPIGWRARRHIRHRRTRCFRVETRTLLDPAPILDRHNLGAHHHEDLWTFSAVYLVADTRRVSPSLNECIWIFGYVTYSASASLRWISPTTISSRPIKTARRTRDATQRITELDCSSRIQLFR